MDFTGVGLRDWVLVILGNIFIILLAVRVVGSYAKREWGELVVQLVAAVFIAAVIYFPDAVVNLLQGIWQLFTGS